MDRFFLSFTTINVYKLNSLTFNSNQKLKKIGSKTKIFISH